MHNGVLILGDGQMALVLADALATRGGEVRVWGPLNDDHVRNLSESRTSPRLPGFVLPRDVRVIWEEDDLLKGGEPALIINAIPTQHIGDVWRRVGPILGAGIPIVSVSKGIENNTLLRPTEVIAESLGCLSADEAGIVQIAAHCPPIAVLSGPTIAAELAKRLPAAMVIASRDEALCARLQELFNVPWLRLYAHDDVLGVELAGATKNVIALAAGMLDGIRAGDNAKSALLARGLAEIARLGVAMGARLDTFFGIAGVGDLATTCFSPEGRNRSCGERLGRGESLQSILHQSSSVVEGVPTTRSVMELAKRHDVDMPIAHAVHEILFAGLSPHDAIQNLMSRDFKPERIG